MSTHEERMKILAEQKANRQTHKNIRLIGPGELLYCDDCQAGEVQLWENTCEERQKMDKDDPRK